MATVRPLQNYLIIEKVEDEMISPGGIHRVRPDKKKPCVAKVLAIGPGVYDEENILRTCGVEVGDTILYLRPEAKTFDIDDEDVTMLRGSGVLGKLK